MTAGWYGKLPAVGDFASRRMRPEFIAALDAWLQQALQHSQEHLGSCWLDSFLTSHIWRFCLFAGVQGEQNWLGLLMPSVDRVGRYFPLTIAAAGDARLLLTLLDGSATSWLNKVETAARGALDVTATIDDFEAALDAAPTPWLGDDCQARSVGPAKPYATLALPGESQPQGFPPNESSLLTLFLTRSAMRCAYGQGLWWTAGPDGDWIDCFVSIGWPSPHAFVKMIARRALDDSSC
jgi:type VI secretion system protein ImpM